jgi:hypothetical protein
MSEIYTYAASVAGTNELIEIFIRKNNLTDYSIQRVSVNSAERVFSNVVLSIPLDEGDYIELKMVCPAWVSNPTSMTIGGYLTFSF